MNPIFKKLLKDSLFHKARIGYLVLALVIAFFGISMVIFGNIMLDKDFEGNFAQSNPAHIMLSYQDAGEIDFNTVLSIPEVLVAEARPMASGEIQVEKGDFMRALFIGVESIREPKVNKFFLKEGGDQLEIYVEQNGKYFFEEEYLRKTRLITAQNDTISLGPAGSVHDTRLPPSRMEHVIYVYLPMKTFNRLFPQASNRLLIRTSIDPSDQQYLLETGHQIREKLAIQYGINAFANIPSQYHPHQNIADGLSYLMKLLGGSLGLMGLVFMVLILLTWLYPQIPDMGTMKSIGVSRSSIQNAYLLFVLLIGLLAFIPGSGLGYIAGKAFNAFVAFTQNFSPVKNPISLGQWSLMLMICLAITLLLSFIPIRNVVRRSVRYAQNLVFSTNDQSIYRLNRLLPSARSKYIGNNLAKNLKLLILTTLLIVTGLSITLIGYNLISSLEGEMDVLENHNLFDYAIDFDETYSIEEKVAKPLASIDQVEYVFVEGMTMLNPRLEVPQRLSLAHINPQIKISDKRMIRGKWEETCTACLYLSQSFKDDFANVAIGDSVKIILANGESDYLRLGGIIKFPEGSSQALRPTAQLDKWNQLYLSSTSQEDLRDELSRYYASRKESSVYVYSAAHTRQIITDHLEGSFFVIAAIGLGALILSIVGMIILINLNLLRRQRDIGILKSIGASPIQIRRLFQEEFILVLLIAIVLGVLISIPFSQSLCYYFGDMVLHFTLNLSMNWGFAAVSIGAYLGLTWLFLRIKIKRYLARNTRYLLQ